jgi:hypothetical protein
MYMEVSKVGKVIFILGECILLRMNDMEYTQRHTG